MFGIIFGAIVLSAFYIVIGIWIGSIIDVLDNELIIVCMFLWPIVLLVYLLKTTIRVLKQL